MKREWDHDPSGQQSLFIYAIDELFCLYLRMKILRNTLLSSPTSTLLIEHPKDLFLDIDVINTALQGIHIKEIIVMHDLFYRFIASGIYKNLEGYVTVAEMPIASIVPITKEILEHKYGGHILRDAKIIY